jgi:hypothetical protein
MPYAGSFTLKDVARKTDTLVVACGRCDRAGRYPVATLIEKHGRSFPIPAVLRMLSDDCPKYTSLAAINDNCGLHCPELAGFFLEAQAGLDGVLTDPG